MSSLRTTLDFVFGGIIQQSRSSQFLETSNQIGPNVNSLIPNNSQTANFPNYMLIIQFTIYKNHEIGLEDIPQNP